MPFRRSDKPRRISRDYHRPRTGNPLFPRAGGRRGGGPSLGSGGARVLTTALGVGLALLAWTAIWGGMFRITDIQVTGVGAPAEAAIRAGIAAHQSGAILGLLPRGNVLFFSSDKALESVAGNVALESVEIRKRLPHSVVVTASEKAARGALDRAGRLLALDESGAIIRELSPAETESLGVLPPGMDAVDTQGLGAETVELPGAAASGDSAAAEERPAPSVPLIRTADPADGLTPSTAPGTNAVPTAAMRLILQAHARLADITGESLRWFTVEPSSETVEAVTDAGWKVLLSSALPFDTQGDRLGIVLKDKIGARRDQLEYVDLRYNERIFFRIKDGSTQ